MTKKNFEQLKTLAARVHEAIATGPFGGRQCFYVYRGDMRAIIAAVYDIERQRHRKRQRLENKVNGVKQ